MSATEGIAQVNTLATHTAISAWAFASAFLAIIVLVAALFLFAWYVGKGPFVALIFSLYSGYALFATFPYLSLLPTAPALTAFFSQVAVFAVFTFISYLVLRRVVVSDFLYIGPIGLIMLCFLATGFLLALVYQVFPLHDAYAFTPAVDALFAPKQWFFAWFVAPLIGLFFLAR